MTKLTSDEAMKKRTELVDLGFTTLPGILTGDLLERWRRYTDELFGRKAVDQKYRYQGSDFHVGSTRLQKSGVHAWLQEYSPLVDEIVDLPAAMDACAQIGLEHQRADDMTIILSKPPHGPPLYWHQDMMSWNSPESASPWPTRIFLSYYMTDTTLENGCLRVIPGTHRKRIPLHDQLPAAHGPEIQAITDYASHPAFSDHPDAIDLPVKAGDLVINDARLLHAARANTTDQRRTLVLQWHSVFQFPNPPSWWEGPIPEAIRDFDSAAKYELTRLPGKYLSA